MFYSCIQTAMLPAGMSDIDNLLTESFSYRCGALLCGEMPEDCHYQRPCRRQCGRLGHSIVTSRQPLPSVGGAQPPPPPPPPPQLQSYSSLEARRVCVQCLASISVAGWTNSPDVSHVHRIFSMNSHLTAWAPRSKRARTLPKGPLTSRKGPSRRETVAHSEREIPLALVQKRRAFRKGMKQDRERSCY